MAPGVRAGLRPGQGRALFQRAFSGASGQGGIPGVPVGFGQGLQRANTGIPGFGFPVREGSRKAAKGFYGVISGVPGWLGALGGTALLRGYPGHTLGLDDDLACRYRSGKIKIAAEGWGRRLTGIQMLRYPLLIRLDWAGISRNGKCRTLVV